MKSLRKREQGTRADESFRSAEGAFSCNPGGGQVDAGTVDSPATTKALKSAGRAMLTPSEGTPVAGTGLIY